MLGMAPLHNLSRASKYELLGRPLREPIPLEDMWKKGEFVRPYMVIFAELYIGFLPFWSYPEGGIIVDYLKCFGPLPEEWKGLYIYSDGLDSWYDQSAEADPEFDLASRIIGYRPEVDAAERELVCSIMRKVFRYRPEERLTATQLLQDESFKALMKRYGC